MLARAALGPGQRAHEEARVLAQHPRRRQSIGRRQLRDRSRRARDAPRPSCAGCASWRTLERVLEIGHAAGIIARPHHGEPARNLDGGELHEIAAFDDLAADPLEDVQAASAWPAPASTTPCALSAISFSNFPCEALSASSLSTSALSWSCGEGGDPGGAHPAERLRRRIAGALAEIDQLRRPLACRAQVAALQRIEAEQEVGQASRDTDPSSARPPASTLSPILAMALSGRPSGVTMYSHIWSHIA